MKGIECCGDCVYYNWKKHRCDDCFLDARCTSPSYLRRLAADRLEQLNTFDKTQNARLLDKINALETENELLRGALAEMNETADRISYDERIMRQAIETYGVQAQCDVAVEEMAELTKAIMKIRRVANDYEKTQSALENLLEEIADVDIMVEQLKIMWGPKQVGEYRRQKLERLERRLKDDRS